MRSYIYLSALVFLAACATPQERCTLDATRELRTVDALIAETRANLARGYAIDRTVETRPRLTFCAGSHRSRFGVSFCRDTDVIERSRPVSIDPAAENRKLGLLQERRVQLEADVRTKLVACET